jgi:ribosomal protein L11 methyltransferase
MANTYIAYHFTIEPIELGSQILIAQLEETAFESFEETEEGVSAYVQKDVWSENILNNIEILSNENFKISYTTNEIEPVNWNEEWEKNFSPIDVDGICHVRAPFHPATNAKYEIVIEPKMSFGTGHHETTHMMIQYLLDLEVANKKTIDMGCGTAILAILAEMKGAHPIDAVDIDNWCYLNSIENAERNNCIHISVYEGDASWLNKGQKYDVFIANINRNILLNDMTTYVNCMNENAVLLLSGFYTEDFEAINECCEKLGLTFESKKERNNWLGLKYIKN